jgi:hypothetical protein
MPVWSQNELDRLHESWMPGNMSIVWLMRAVGPRMISHTLIEARPCRALYWFEKIRQKKQKKK